MAHRQEKIQIKIMDFLQMGPVESQKCSTHNVEPRKRRYFSSPPQETQSHAGGKVTPVDRGVPQIAFHGGGRQPSQNQSSRAFKITESKDQKEAGTIQDGLFHKQLLKCDNFLKKNF